MHSNLYLYINLLVIYEFYQLKLPYFANEISKYLYIKKNKKIDENLNW